MRYLCDPEKYTACKKTACHINGGPCRMTVFEEFAKTEKVKCAEDNPEKARYFFCSNCGYGVQDVFEGNYEGKKEVLVFEKGLSWNYCPNCGAKMDKQEE